MSDKKLEKFLSIGLDEKVAKQTLNNPKTASALEQTIDEAGITSGCDKPTGNLIYTVATKLPANHSPIVEKHRRDLLKYIVARKIASVNQLDAAIKYLKKAATYDEKEFESTSGVGAVVTKDMIVATVAKVLEANKAALLEQRYRMVGALIAEVNASCKWGDGKTIKEEFDSQVLALLGPRTEEDAAKIKQKVAKEVVKTSAPATTEEPDDFLQGRPIPWAFNPPDVLEKHKKFIGSNGAVTRFPPEPNGFLHLGHAKAMKFNFGIAQKHKGYCIMRFDDTNPEAEKTLYIDNILENVEWLIGHKPVKITFSSDYFQELYDLAVLLIRKDKAYVDHQTAEEIEEYRALKKDSPWRNRPIEESVKLFDDMRRGRFEEGKATLRMKGDMKDPNPQMWDVVAYRIKYVPHPHVGDKWCIYPSYDYSHCIIDSLENITHSLCTLEFEVRRESYYWLLHQLDLYKPKVWEYSRLNVTYNVMSKRRLLKMVEGKYVRGWDDPRLLTLNGLRRRGFTAEAIGNFCAKVGVTRNSNIIPIDRLEFEGRLALDRISRRALVVADPIRVVLTNYPADKVEYVDALNFPPPGDATPEQKQAALKDVHRVPFSKILYIERADFRLEGSKNFFGLSPGSEVYLKYAYNIKCEDVKKNAQGEVVEILATVDFKSVTKCKGKITWVAQPKPGVEPLAVELRLYEYLFKSLDPSEIGREEDDKRNWLDDLNPNSETVVKGAFADPSLAEVKKDEHFQFERLGFFVVDPDTNKDCIVFNRTVKLKDGKGKEEGKEAVARTSAKKKKGK